MKAFSAKPATWLHALAGNGAAGHSSDCQPGHLQPSALSLTTPESFRPVNPVLPVRTGKSIAVWNDTGRLTPAARQCVYHSFPTTPPSFRDAIR
jgi:hypothetical protein